MFITVCILVAIIASAAFVGFKHPRQTSAFLFAVNTGFSEAKREYHIRKGQLKTGNSSP